jgi:hypothetical protein
VVPGAGDRWVACVQSKGDISMIDITSPADPGKRLGTSRECAACRTVGASPPHGSYGSRLAFSPGENDMVCERPS